MDPKMVFDAYKKGWMFGNKVQGKGLDLLARVSKKVEMDNAANILTQMKKVGECFAEKLDKSASMDEYLQAVTTNPEINFRLEVLTESFEQTLRESKVGYYVKQAIEGFKEGYNS